MKGLLFFFLVCISIGSCKKDERNRDPDPVIKTIVGKWKLDAYEQTVDRQKVWVKVSADQPSYLTFRFDGVILDSKGLPQCCGPNSFYLNGTFFKIEPKETVPVNPQCAFVDCIGCESWTIEQTDNQFILSYCQNIPIRARFIRV